MVHFRPRIYGSCAKQSWNLFCEVEIICKGAPPEVEPPGRNCQCSWSEWIDEDSPNSDKGKNQPQEPISNSDFISR